MLGKVAHGEEECAAATIHPADVLLPRQQHTWPMWRRERDQRHSLSPIEMPPKCGCVIALVRASADGEETGTARCCGHCYHESVDSKTANDATSIGQQLHDKPGDIDWMTSGRAARGPASPSLDRSAAGTDQTTHVHTSFMNCRRKTHIRVQQSHGTQKTGDVDSGY